VYNRQSDQKNNPQSKYFIFYDPAHGVPNIPTASSPHTRINTITIKSKIKNRYLELRNFLYVMFKKREVTERRIPAMIKSDRVQTTWSVKNIATKGIRSRKSSMPAL